MNQIGTAQSRTVHLAPSGVIARVLALFALIILLVIGLIIAIPIIILLFVLGLCLFAYLKVRSLFARAHKPNGPLDGRHNVRVMDRDD